MCMSSLYNLEHIALLVNWYYGSDTIHPIIIVTSFVSLTFCAVMSLIACFVMMLHYVIYVISVISYHVLLSGILGFDLLK